MAHTCGGRAGPRPGSSAGGGTLSNGAGSDPYGVMAAAMGKGPDTFQMQAEEFPALGPAPARAASGSLPGDALKQQADVRST